MARWLLPPLMLLALGGWVIAQDHSLWYDELYTAEVAPLAIGDIAEAVIRGEGTIAYLRDAPPSYNAPYYVVTHLWLSVTGLEANELGLRLFSLLAMAGAMVAFTAAVTRLAGRRAGLAAGLVAAFNPFIVQYAAEARGYGLAMAAIALSALGLARWFDGRPRALLLFGIAGAASGLAHWFALLVLVALAVAALAVRGRQALSVAVTAAAAALPTLGLVAIAVANGVGASGAEWIGGVGASAPGLLLKAWSGNQLALALLTVAAAGAGLLSTSPRPARVVGGIWIGVPVLIVTALDIAARPVFVARYLLPACLGLALLVALGITAAAARHRVAGVSAAAAILVASVWATVQSTGLGPRENVRAAVASIAAEHQPGQAVVAAARWDALGLDYYARHRYTGLLTDLVLPAQGVPQAQAVWVVRRAAAGVKGDPERLLDLDTELRGRGMHIASEQRFAGRASDVVVQRWEPAGGT